GHALDQLTDVAALDVVDDATTPRGQNDLAEDMLGLRPGFRAGLLLGVSLNEEVRELLDGVAGALGYRLFCLRPGVELQGRRIVAALHLMQRLGCGVPRLGQRKPTIEGELARLTFEAVAHRPCCPPAGLLDEVQASAAAVGYLAAHGYRLDVLDEPDG